MSAAVSIWLLVFVIFTKDGGTTVSQVYESRFNCEIKMGLGATIMSKDNMIVGWVAPVPCVEIKPARKI